MCSSDLQRLAHRLTDQAVDQNKLPKRISATTAAVTTSATPSDNKRKWEGIPARDQFLFSPKHSSAAPTTTRVRISSHQAVRGRVDIGDFTRYVISVTDTTVDGVAKNVVRDASS